MKLCKNCNHISVSPYHIDDLCIFCSTPPHEFMNNTKRILDNGRDNKISWDTKLKTFIFDKQGIFEMSPNLEIIGKDLHCIPEEGRRFINRWNHEISNYQATQNRSSPDSPSFCHPCLDSQSLDSLDFFRSIMNR